MQFFGARANIAKALLLAINGGKDEPVYNFDGSDLNADGMEAEKLKIKEKGGTVIIPGIAELKNKETLDFDEVWQNFLEVLDWVAQRYARAMNIIHYMHDRYHYEALQMALHDEEVRRFMAYGFAGLSIVADSLSAIKHAKVHPIWGKDGIANDYKIEGQYPQFGNDDDRVDLIATEVVKQFITKLRKYKTYRKSIPTLSILTITSNVVYGKATGNTPDGRISGTPFAPGANPMHQRDRTGAIASLNSVAKISYDDAQDGISNTFSIVPASLGKSLPNQIDNLVQILDGYFVGKQAHHLNVNVLNRETLIDAQKHPEKYPQLTIRVSGYAVWFNRLNKEQQDEVISRSFHTII
jgi:formate C-acetyltransferase